MVAHRSLSLVCLLACVAAGGVAFRAFAAVPGSPILFYDSFEETKPYWKNGSYEAGKGTIPDTRAFKASQDKDQTHRKIAWVEVGGAPLKFDGVEFSDINVGVKVFGKNLRTIRVELTDTGWKTYSARVGSARDGQWTDIVANLGQARAGASRIPPKMNVRWLRIVGEASRDEVPEMLIDDVLVTVSANPKQLWPAAMMQAAKRAQQKSSLKEDGFHFTADMVKPLLESQRHGRHRGTARSVLPVGMGEHASDFANAMEAESTRRKIESAKLPEGLKIDSLEDLRALLPALLAGVTPETVLLAPSAKAFIDAGTRDGPRHAEVISSRCMEAGAVPVWVLPDLSSSAPKRDRDALNDANAKIGQALARMGVPYVDAGFVLKADPAKFEAKEPNADACKALAGLSGKALDHIDEHVHRRRP